MGNVIPFPNQRLDERLEPLRDFLDDAEQAQRGVLNAEDRDELEFALYCAWPGAVALEQPWITKLAFALAGIAIGFGIQP